MKEVKENIPKIFWKYYDQYRRKQISVDEFSQITNIKKSLLRLYLSEISK